MPTDTERREAAVRLMDEVGCGSSWPGMERLGLILGIKREPRTGWEGRILTRLADLIYPGDMSQGRRDTVACDRDAPGHEHIQRSEPSEPKVRCVAEVKVDGEQLEKLVHDAVVKLIGIDRDALMELADEMDAYTKCDDERCGREMPPRVIHDFARRIREALGVQDGD